ncbi:tubulin epsilon and delta complex protein 1-like isoform X1 [Mercenaria mercenaria]|uniref:tubulin epsilon and delta complex protein 1-like isoform X1 n=2 Tax=Mercenaria mercenaria TaxID=6596 RepID=UPI00234E7D5D|nr:tubulin epsilon and delta complex protein 1-like isoform X1 [Mercenaria mercenaria]
MSNVREVIELLTKVFKDNGTTPIKAECFRAAKFNKNETTASLWRLLFELLYILNYGPLEEYVNDFTDQLKPDELVIYTKYAMQEQGYFSREFSTLPDDMNMGSREILFAIGWLLSSKKVVDKFIDLQCSPLDQEFPVQEPVVVEQQTRSTSKLGAIQKAQQLQFLNGRLCLSLKTLYSLYHEETRLQHQVHKSTMGVGSSAHTPHLSVIEVYLLRHPEQLKKCIQQLEKDNTRLERLLLWKEHEHIFWKWMESVLQLKLEEASQNEEQVSNQPVVHYNIPVDLLASVSMSRRNLESAIMKFEPIITQLEEIWETKQDDMTVDQMQKLDAAVKAEIQSHQNNLEDRVLKHGPPLYRNSRLTFIKPSQKKLSNVQIPALNNVTTDGLSDPVNIQSEIESLQEHINQLECEIRRKERYYRNRLDKMASHIPGAICIQPASLTR